MPVITMPPEPLGGIHYTSDYWDYWCVALSNVRGIELVLGNTIIADVGWLVTDLGIDIELSGRVIEESGAEKYLNTYILTDGVLILTLRRPTPYARPNTLAGRPCTPPQREVYTAWARLASELASALGDELIRHAYTAWLHHTVGKP